MLSVRMTKDIFAKGVSKAIPVVGGLVSGTITFASMRPMGLRLVKEFDKANFAYTQADFESDMNTINNISDAEFYEFEEKNPINRTASNANTSTITEELVRLKELLDIGILTQEEFDKIKSKLISRL